MDNYSPSLVNIIIGITISSFYIWCWIKAKNILYKSFTDYVSNTDNAQGYLKRVCFIAWCLGPVSFILILGTILWNFLTNWFINFDG